MQMKKTINLFVFVLCLSWMDSTAAAAKLPNEASSWTRVMDTFSLWKWRHFPIVLET